MSGKVFYTLSVAFFSGVFVFSHVDLSKWALVSATLLSCVLCAILRDRKSAVLFCVGVCAFSLGGIRIETSKFSTHSLDHMLGKKIEISGVVCDEPEEKEVTLRFCFKADNVQDKVLVTTGRYPVYEYGDRLVASGTLALPESFETYEGGPVFDYAAYLSKDGIRYVMFRPRIEKVGEGEGNLVRAALFRIKGMFVAKMRELVPEPESALLGGILLGDRDAIPKEVTDDFKSAGLVHILVLSGYNVTIVAESIMKAGAFLPRIFERVFGGISIILFALMTGATATTVRASIMALVVILARSAARRYDVSRALVFAAILMVVHDPRILAFDLSFELSFLATLSLVVVSPLVVERLSFITEKGNLREIVSTTLSTQIFVLPLIMHSMGEVSVVSLVTNLLVLPLIPYAMFLGFIAVVSGFLIGSLAFPLAWTTTVILSYAVSVARFFSDLPFSSVRMTASAFALAVMYVVYTTILVILWRRKNSSQRISN